MNTPTTLPACSGPCEQGKKPCSTPEACEIPEPSTGVLLGWAALPVVMVAIGAAAVQVLNNN